LQREFLWPTLRLSNFVSLAWNWHGNIAQAEGRGGAVFRAGESREGWWAVGNAPCVIPTAGMVMSAAAPLGALPGLPPQFSDCCATAAEFRCALALNGVALRNSWGARSDVLPLRDAARLRRDFHRNANRCSSAWAIGGMVLLLAVCSWIAEGADGARRAIFAGAPRPDGPAISREAMYRWFGARKLGHHEIPGLFHILADVCRRARLPRPPDLYYIAAPTDMNAYALGGPQCAAIVVTEGLLRGMSPDEIAGILAHEVAHIRNNDAWAMGWVTALRRAVEWTSSSALASLRARDGGAAATAPLAALLGAAPAIAQLLVLALSRSRELDADATALELTENLRALVAALDKLERHHAGPAALAAAVVADRSLHLLRSHPTTSERVGALLNLAH
jgi:heat shock protein HtpX